MRTVLPLAAGKGPTVFDLSTVTDSLGRQLQIVYPDGEIVTNTYDAAGMLNAIGAAGAGWSRTYASNIRYDVFGNRTRLEYGNGAVSTWSYEPARVRLTSITTMLGSTKLQDLQYSYDPASNPTQVVNNLAGLSGGSTTQPGPSTITLTYDGVDRLLRAVGQAELDSSKSTSYDEQFAYSASHNLLHKQRTHLVTSSSGVPTAPTDTNFSSDYTYTSARPHLPTQIGQLLITYDPSGNPTTRLTAGTSLQQNLTWDDDNRLVDFTSGGVHQINTYDASGLRVHRKGQDDTIFSSPYFDVDNDTQGIKHIFAGSTRIASELTKFASGTSPPPPAKQGTAYFFHADHLGSTGVLTQDNGTIQESREYFVDGEEWLQRGSNNLVDDYLFTAKPLDSDTGLYDFGQRYYDPRTSYWLGVDTAFKSDPSESRARPLVLAPLAFAALSPSRFSDPDGRDWKDYVPGPVRRAAGFVRREVIPRALGAGEAVAGAATLGVAAVACTSGLGCSVGAGLGVIGTDLLYSGSKTVVNGRHEPTLVGQAFGERAEAVENVVAGAAIVSASGLLARSVQRSVASESSSTSVWDKNPFARGNAIENALGRNLSGNYPVIDRFANGVATSIKSIDLGAKTYQNVATLARTVKTYIDDVAAFNGRRWADVNIRAGDITGRALELATPASGGTAAQQSVLDEAVRYGQRVGVNVTIIPF